MTLGTMMMALMKWWNDEMIEWWNDGMKLNIKIENSMLRPKWKKKKGKNLFGNIFDVQKVKKKTESKKKRGRKAKRNVATTDLKETKLRERNETKSRLEMNLDWNFKAWLELGSPWQRDQAFILLLFPFRSCIQFQVFFPFKSFPHLVLQTISGLFPFWSCIQFQARNY